MWYLLHRDVFLKITLKGYTVWKKHPQKINSKIDALDSGLVLKEWYRVGGFLRR